MPVDTAPGPQFVNGDEVSFSEIKLTVHLPSSDSVSAADFKDVSWKSAVTIGKTRQGGVPRRRTSGVVDWTASAIFYRSGKKEMIRQLSIIAEQNGLVRDGDKVMWGRVKFDLEITFSYPDTDEISTVVLEQCRFIDDDEKSAEGEAPQEATLAIDPMDIYEMIDGRKCVLR